MLTRLTRASRLLLIGTLLLLPGLGGCKLGEDATGIPEKDQPAVVQRAQALLPGEIAKVDATPETPPSTQELSVAVGNALQQAVTEYHAAHPDAGPSGFWGVLGSILTAIATAWGGGSLAAGLLTALSKDSRWRELLVKFIGALNPATGNGVAIPTAWSALLALWGAKRSEEVPAAPPSKMAVPA